MSLSTAVIGATSLFSLGGQLGVIDGSNSSTASPVRLRVVDALTNSLQTIAGTDKASGNGGDRTLARFSNISSLLSKPTTSSGFSSGIYIADYTAGRVMHTDPSSSIISFVAGTGSSYSSGTNLDTNYSLSGTKLFHLALNSIGSFTIGNRSIWNVAADKSVLAFLSGASTNVLTLADGSTSTTTGMQGGDQYAGLIYDSSGNLYFGGYLSTGTNVNRIKVRKSDGSLYNVIGTSANTSSADCTTAGCAHTLSIAGASGYWFTPTNFMGPYDNRFNSNEGRLLFAEAAKIRFISRAYDIANSKLGTLTDQSGTAINFGRAVGAFRYTYINGTSEQIDKIFYVSNDGKLYCYKVSTGSDSTCTNASLGPSTSITTLHPAVLEMDESGSIYGISNSGDSVFKYVP